MPYCEVITTAKVEKDAEAQLHHALAAVIEKIPGKSERWVMIHLEDQARMAFSGDNSAPAAMLTVKTFGELEAEAYDLLTQEFCAAAEKLLSVPADRVYVVYEPIRHWGWNSRNF